MMHFIQIGSFPNSYRNRKEKTELDSNVLIKKGNGNINTSHCMKYLTEPIEMCTSDHYRNLFETCIKSVSHGLSFK